ncbi:protein FAM214A-like [Actinia tenebrosa]|uniref:Protein FAM214A-like n=1 Tax=Actinia tenebrosa TaxID=6105 RepID=A0A6P8J5K4_ACTTE|nr:protein FAM214A-like [Actinia tenebrosa]
MKPLEVQTADVEEMECELHSKEFFVHVGMLVLEGRMPQQSDRGRIEGHHCGTSKGKVCHTCDDKNEECKEARTWTQIMEAHWQSTHPLVIDVLVKLNEQTDHLLLLEQWTVKIVCSACGPTSSGSQLLQAVRSHLHFSQLSAWLSSSKGILPYEIKYRINEQAEHQSYTFSREPTEHVFPLASLPSPYSLQVQVKSLPRCSIQELLKESQVVEEIFCNNSSDFSLLRSEPSSSSSSSWFSDTRSPLRKRTCLNKAENGQVFVAKEKATEVLSSDSQTRQRSYKTINLGKDFLKLESDGDWKRACLNEAGNGQVFVCKEKETETLFSESQAKSSTCTSRRSDKAINLEKEFLKLATSCDLKPCKSTENLQEESQIGKDSEFLNLGATPSNYEPIMDSNGTSNGISNLSERIKKLGRDIANIDRNVNTHAYQSEQRISGLSALLKEASKECTAEMKTDVSGAREKEKRTSREVAKMVLQRKCRSLSDRGVRVESLRNREPIQKEASRNTAEDRVCNKAKQSPTRQGTTSNSSDVDIHAIRQPVNRDCTYRRSVQLPFSACTEPVFNPKTGLPVSSSPAPLRRSTNELCEDTTDFSNGLSNKVDYRELSKLLSRSAPASTTQSLLVNFEESVLNGRMEPVGTVEGFVAELSTSGSFCPRHVKLPIISCFYRLSDDDAPSPYMGYISLKDDPIGRRGYHVPKKGTIQLTVFNPNMTVVKMFVVLYDCSDMPPRSQTFLRQKTYSALKGNEVKNEVQQNLHYLLHLRFASSKSGKIYLHTDIRVIFARQPPDLGNIYQLFTVTDGPTNPKYTKKHHSSEEPEC